jgi:hypothetical protein
VSGVIGIPLLSGPLGPAREAAPRTRRRRKGGQTDLARRGCEKYATSDIFAYLSPRTVYVE